jgi:hypothetical protein
MTLVFEYVWVGAFGLLVLCPLVLLAGCALQRTARRVNTVLAQRLVRRTRGGLAAQAADDGPAVGEQLDVRELHNAVPERS